MIELETLPKGWTVARLEEVCGILDGKRKPINATERANRIDGKNIKELYPYYGATGQVGLIDDFLLDGEFVLLGEDGAPFLDPFKNKSYLVRGKVWVNNHAHVLKSYFNNQYLNHYLNIVNYRNHVTGTTRLKLNQSAMKGISIPIAPFPEQTRILAKLEQLLTDLDKGIEYLKAAQQQLKIYRQAVLKWAFEGKLTNEKFEKTPLSTVIEKPKYGTTKKCDYKVKGTGVLRIPNIGNGYINNADLKFAKFDKEELKAYSLIDGDLLTIRSNGSVDLVGKCALVTQKDTDYLFAGYLIRLRPLKEKVIPKFLLLVLSSHDLRIQIESKAKSSSGVNNINSEEIKRLIISLPSLSQQEKIVQEIESRLSVCDKIEETIANSLQQAEALRLSIIKKAFEGKLVPQDPNDEPAEKLLERIKLEKLKKEQLKKGKNKSGGKIKRIS